MAGNIVAVLPDGTRLEFPPGTDPAVIQATVQRAAASEGGPNPTPGGENLRAAPPGSAAGAPNAGPPPRQSDPGVSFGARMLKGPALDRIFPLSEMIARGTNAVAPGLVSDERLQSLLDHHRQQQEEYETRRLADGQEGFDAGRMSGTVLSDLGLAKALGPRWLTAPKTAMETVKSGATIGGAASFASPVPGSDKMGGAEFAKEKAIQTGIGAGAGALIGPIAATLSEKALGLGSVVLGNIASRVKSRVLPSQAQRVTRSDELLETYLETQAQAVNVDWAKLPEAMRNSLREATRRATTVTGELPDEAVKNRLIATSEGLPQLTLGQATRNPTQFSRELNSPDEELRDYLGNQQLAATQRLGEVREAAGPDASAYGAGEKVAATLEAQRKAIDAEIGALYDVARESKGGYNLIQNTTDFAKTAKRDLKQQQLWENLPSGLRNQLDLLTSNDGRFKLTARQAAQMLKNINSQTTNMRDPSNVALGTLKSHLNDLLDNAQFRDDAGSEAVKAFRAASAKRAEKGRWENSSRAIADLSSRNPKTLTENVVNRYVMNGSVDDLTGLWKTLPDDVRQVVKRQFVNQVAQKAMNGYGSQASSAAAAVKYLNQYPKEKLNVMFSTKELSSLRNTLEYLRLTKDAPPGSFVNRSGTAVALHDLLSRSQGIPLIGPNVSSPLLQFGQRLQSDVARGPGLHVLDEPGESAVRDGLSGAVPFLAVPGYQTFLGEK